MTPEQTLQVEALRTRSDRSEIFNYVIDHLRRQGKKSLMRDRPVFGPGFCSYRGDGGTMCAIGALITDDEYDNAWEGQGIDRILKNWRLNSTLHACISQHEEMLLDLQTFHDEWLIYEDCVFNNDSEDRVAFLRKKWDIR